MCKTVLCTVLYSNIIVVSVRVIIIRLGCGKKNWEEGIQFFFSWKHSGHGKILTRREEHQNIIGWMLSGHEYSFPVSVERRFPLREILGLPVIIYKKILYPITLYISLHVV